MALTFSGSPYDVWVGDAAYAVVEGVLGYSNSGEGIWGRQSWATARALRIAPISGATTQEFTVRREVVAAATEVGVCLLDADAGSGFLVLLMGSTLRIQKATAGEGGAELASVTVPQVVGLDEYACLYDPSTKEVTVTLDGTEVLSYTYTGTETGLRPGFQSYRTAAEGLSIESYDAYAAPISIALNFAPLADVNPYVDPDGWSTATGGFKIESGALAATADNSNLVYDDVDLPQTGLTIQGVLKESSVPFVYRGLKFFKTNGAGYFAQLYSTEFSLWKQADFGSYEVLGSKTYSEYAAGAGIRFEYAANEAGTEVIITVYLNDVVMLTYTDSASPIIEDGTNGPLRPALGIYSNGGLGFTSALVGGGGVPEEPEEPSFAINQLVAGSTSTITFSEAYTPTSLIISDGAGGTVTVTSFTGSGASWGFTCPDLVDETVGPMLGDVSVVITDGVTPFDAISGAYVKTGYTPVVITSLAEGGVGLGFDPALAVGNQLAYQADKGTISEDSLFSGSVAQFTGTQIVWEHNKDDYKWRSVSFTTIDGAYVPDDATIDTLAATLYAGVPVAFTTTGFESAITSVTVGGVACAFTESGGDGTLTLPAWAENVVQPLNHGENYAVVITDGDVSATVDRAYGVPAGLEHRNIPGSVSTASDSLYQYPLFVSGHNVYIPDLAGGSIAEDGTYVDIAPGTYPGFWVRDFDYEMHQFTLVVAPPAVQQFTFVDVPNATPLTPYTSNTITVAGITESVAVSISGGTYSKNGGAFTAAAGTAVAGDTFAVKVTSGTSARDSINSTLTIGTISDTYSVNGALAGVGAGNVLNKFLTGRFL